MDHNGRYIEVDGVPVPEPDLLKWARSLEGPSRRVDQTRIGSIRISTVFMGIDHRFSDDGSPQLYETMVFGGPLDGHQDRYASREEAIRGHLLVVEKVKAERKELP